MTLMCWVALDRAAKLAEIRGGAGLADGWRVTAEEIKQDILANGLTDGGVLRQHYETDSLDASTLLAAMFGFLPHDDERLRASVLAIAEDLTEDGFVLRHRTDETDGRRPHRRAARWQGASARVLRRGRAPDDDDQVGSAGHDRTRAVAAREQSPHGPSIEFPRDGGDA